MNDVELNGKAVKIAVLESRMDTVQDDLRLIKENHLPHIQEAIDKINTKIAFWVGGATVLGWIGNAVISRL